MLIMCVFYVNIYMSSNKILELGTNTLQIMLSLLVTLKATVITSSSSIRNALIWPTYYYMLMILFLILLLILWDNLTFHSSVQNLLWKNWDTLTYFLDITVTRHPKSLFLSQKKYAYEIIVPFGMSSCKLCVTLVDIKLKLSHR